MLHWLVEKREDLPFAQSTSVVDDLGRLDVTESCKVILQCLLINFEENIANVESLVHVWLTSSLGRCRLRRRSGSGSGSRGSGGSTSQGAGSIGSDSIICAGSRRLHCFLSFWKNPCQSDLRWAFISFHDTREFLELTRRANFFHNLIDLSSRIFTRSLDCSFFGDSFLGDLLRLCALLQLLLGGLVCGGCIIARPSALQRRDRPLPC